MFNEEHWENTGNAKLVRGKAPDGRFLKREWSHVLEISSGGNIFRDEILRKNEREKRKRENTNKKGKCHKRNKLMPTDEIGRPGSKDVERSSCARSARYTDTKNIKIDLVNHVLSYIK